MSGVENTLLEVQKELSDLMSDIEKRISEVYDKYTDSSNEIPKLPSYDSLKNDKVRYNCARQLTQCIDELNEMKLRAGILLRSFYEYQNFQPPTKTEYNVVARFKQNVKIYSEKLDQYRWELSDLIKNANNKLRVLDSVQFFDM